MNDDFKLEEYKAKLALDLEYYKAKNASQLESYKQHSAFVIESNKGTLQFATLAIKSIFLANGAAAIATLTFIGHKPSADSLINLENVALSVKWFAIGVLCSIVTAMLAYVAQYVITEASSIEYTVKKSDNADAVVERRFPMPLLAIVLHVIAVIAALTSAVLFMWGMKVAASL